ncbi:hypothetical protein LSAT2_026839 [Lamellibrachia satsuma]|nr:hypothetical protein LSAT2_026839 [Lamellibrachia satsuma]
MQDTEDDMPEVTGDAVHVNDMSPDLSSVISKDFLTCRICLEAFSQPRMLPCLHTFCHACLQQCIRTTGPDEDSIACPTCRSRTPIPPGGAAGFKANFFVSSLQDALSLGGRRLCENCSEQQVATARCLDCRDFLCDVCCDAHKRTKLTKRHQVLTMEELQQGEHTKHARQPVMCSSHNEPITLVCIQCNRPICLTCKVTVHDGHKASDLKDTARSERKILSSMLGKARDSIATMRRHLHNLDHYEGAMDANNTDILGAIQRRRLVLRDLIKSHTRKLAEELQQITQKAHCDIGQRRGQLNTQMASLRDVIHLTTQLLDHGSDDDLVLMKGELQRRLGSLQNVPSGDFSDVQQTQLDFCADSDINITWLCGELHAPIADIELTRDITRARCVNTFEVRTETDEKVCYVSSIATAVNDNIFMLDQNNRKVKIFNHYGILVGEFRLSEHTKNPVALVILHDRKIAILDERTGIQVFTHTGRHVRQVTCPARAPLGMAVHKTGQVLISDRQTRSIFVVDLENNSSVQNITMPGVFQKPAAVASTNDGHILVADVKCHCVHVVNTGGHQVAGYGTKGNGENEINTPTSICTDRYSNIIVTDYHNHRVHVLSHDAKFLMYIADASDGLLRPTAVAVSNRGHVIVAEDNGKVLVFKYTE